MLGPECYPLYLGVLFLLILFKTALQSAVHPLINESGHSRMVGCFILAVAAVLFFGFRPHNSYFPDTHVYAGSFENARYTDFEAGTEGDVLFRWLCSVCAKSGMSVEAYFCLMATLYIVPILVVIHRWFKGNEYLALLFVFASFTFYTFGGSIMRNGLACSFSLFALCLWTTETGWRKIYAFVSAIIAFNFHNSAALPLLGLFLSIFCVRKIEVAILIWVISMVVSLLIGPMLGVYVSEYVEEERLRSYTEAGLLEDHFEGFSHSGFRWDFLIYSLSGILMIGYVGIIKKVRNRTFQIISNTYVLTNAMWIILIYSLFSDRFARLSWVLIPFIFLYPIVHFDIWRQPGRDATLIIWGEWLFLLVMAWTSVSNFIIGTPV